MNDWLQDNPEHALKRIYSDNFSWLENYIRQNSGNPDDARDIFQEGIAAAWMNLRTGKFVGTRDKFNAYVRQICKYKWINELRSGKRKKTVYNEQVSEQDIPDNVSEGDLEHTMLLKKSFSMLGEKCREVLEQFYYNQKPLGEIATQMQNTEDSIKTIKYRCMMQLRKFFLDEMKKNGEI
ncbi:MAG: sigma-70 family RNA polymerase sigma factor [Chitinophagaceae bacterium]|nr:sigma-70 family RNA polymerase sigma factor [Chitinophagaceae bacterium]